MANVMQLKVKEEGSKVQNEAKGGIGEGRSSECDVEVATVKEVG